MIPPPLSPLMCDFVRTAFYIAWNDNNAVTTCEVREMKPAGDSSSQNSVKTYAVTFVVDGTIISTQTAEEGNTVKMPADLSKKGYTFDGWELKFDKVSVI